MKHCPMGLVARNIQRNPPWSTGVRTYRRYAVATLNPEYVAELLK